MEVSYKSSGLVRPASGRKEMGSGCGIRTDNKPGGRESFKSAEVHPTGGSSEHVASGCYKSLKVKVNHKLPPGIHVVISKYQMDLDTSQAASPTPGMTLRRTNTI